MISRTIGRLALGIAVLAAAPAAHAQERPPPIPGLPRDGGDDALPPGPHPRITFEKKSYDFGQLYQGEKRDVVVVFTNQGEAPLIIRKIKTTCGCTAALLSTDEVAPGESGKIEIAFDSKDKIGYQDIRVYLYTNDPREKDFGQFVSAVRVGAEVTTLWNVLPGAAYFGAAVRGERVERKVRITLRDKKTKAFEVTKIDVPRPWIEAKTAKIAQEIGGGSPAIELTVTLTERAPIGLVNEVLKVHTDHPKQPTISVPVIATLTGDIVWAPEFLEFQRVKRGEGRERAIVIDRPDQKPLLEVVSAEVTGPPGSKPNDLLEVELAEVIERRRWEAIVRVKKDAPPGPFWAKVRLFVRDTEQPIIEITAFGIVEGVLRTEPGGVIFDRARIGEPVRVKIVRDDGEKFLVKKIQALGVPVFIEAKLGAIDDELSFVVKPSGRAAGDKGELIIETDVPGEERVRIPIRVIGEAEKKKD